MVSESLTLTFNLLTGYYSRQQPSSLRLVMLFFWEWSVSELSGFCVYLEDDSTDLRENFFRGLGENLGHFHPTLKGSALGLNWAISNL